MPKNKRAKKKIIQPRSNTVIPSIPLAKIKVVGIGGGGGNAVARMSQNFVRGIEFIAINTDHQDLDYCEVKKKCYIGRNLTKGLGTGMNPEIGRQAAEENRSEIAEALAGADIVFIAAGFGGGTGTGSGPVVAEIAKQQGALTLAFVTKPFAFEGGQRDRIAQEGLLKIKDKVDALVVIPNDRIFTVISKDTPILKAFEAIDEVLRNALQGLVEIILSPGMINVDFADVRAILQDAGTAIVGVGITSGQDRAAAAVQQALHSPLLEVSPKGAKGILFGISGGRDMKMTEINDAAKLISQVADPSAKIIFGAYYDRKLKPNQIKITVIATGFNSNVESGSLFEDKVAESKSSSIFDEIIPLEKKSNDKGLDRDSLRRGDKELGLDDFIGTSPKKSESKKKDDDVWDIPTFLRKKKR